MGTADPSGWNEHRAPSSPKVIVVVKVAVEREENGEEGENGWGMNGMNLATGPG